ncbi:hypothetical protein ACT4UT_31250, partial [Bacillus sp. B-TM1]
EYYAFFIVISMLEQIGFEARNSIREQIQEHFYVDGLQDGTTVVLHRDDMKVHVAFNDLIETHPLIALSKGSNFYNGEDTKKPDIRLDLVTDQTSAHDPLNGYIPVGYTLEEAAKLREEDPERYVQLSKESMTKHVEAMLAMQEKGAITFDYGNNIRQ